MYYERAQRGTCGRCFEKVSAYYRSFLYKEFPTVEVFNIDNVEKQVSDNLLSFVDSFSWFAKCKTEHLWPVG